MSNSAKHYKIIVLYLEIAILIQIIKKGETDMSDKVQLTEKGLKKLKEELKLLTEEKRHELKDTIEEMRNRGDLSENDGYTLALEQFQANEKRISDIQEQIENAEIVETSNGKDKVTVGSTVKVEIEGDTKTIELVGESEADPTENKVSLKSPLGANLLDKKVGDKVRVKLPKSVKEYTIKEIA